jgi:CHAT domain-containing protein/tetratricopeptide (TPR) repeat protein
LPESTAMASVDLIQQVLGMPDVEAQKRFLREHASLLDDECADALKQQADQFIRSNIQRSQQMADLLLYLAETTGDPLHRALGLLARANACSVGLGEYEKAIELYDQAAQIYQSQDRPVQQARSQVGKIWSLTNLGRYAEALEAGQWASRVLEAHAEWKLLASVTVNLSIVHSRAGNDARALEMLDRAGSLYEQLGERGGAGWLRVQQNRAVFLRNLGYSQDSIQASQIAQEGFERLGHKVAAARALQNLALTYFLLGRYNEALVHLEQVSDVFLADGRRRDAMLVELFVSDCLLQLRRFNDVLDKCSAVRSLFAELGTWDFAAQAIVNEGVAYAELGRYAEALTSFAEARQMFEEEGNRVRVASTDLETATVLQRQERLDESLALAEACAEVFVFHDLPVEEAQACLVAARAAAALGQHSKALDLTTKARNVGEKRNLPTLRYQSQHLLGSLASAQGNLLDALAAYDRAIDEVERLRGRLMVEFRVGFAEDKEGIYEDAVGICLDLDQPLQGLEYAERAKSHALLDLVAHRLDLSIRARAADDRPLAEEIMRLRADRDRMYRRWESDGESGERGWSSSEGERSQTQHKVLALEKRITELWHQLLIRNADYAREAALWTIRTEPVQPYLNANTLLVEYFLVHGKLVVFLVTAEAVQARRLDCDLAKMQTLMQLLWLNLKMVPRSPPNKVSTLETNARGLLRQMYKEVLAPLADLLDDYHHLLIVPHGPLHYLPFHALHDGTSYLLERHEISYLPGASFLRYCQEPQLADSGLLAVGHSHGGRLPHASQEAAAVAALLDGQLLLEDKATLAEIERVAPECRSFHLAAHGDFRPDNPLFSGLRLADGWLTTLDIFNLRLKASLVTLSACQTGRNVVGGGDELLGLMRAFLCAGAASLVLSLWAVEDQSTAQLMETFYQKLVQGWTKGDALRHAQLRFLARQDTRELGDRAHPYFWAPFFLVGNAGPL